MRTLLPLFGSLLLAIACGCPQKTGTEAPPATQPAPAQPTPTEPTPAPPQPSQPTPLPPPTQGQPTQGSGSAAEPAPNWPKGAPGMGENCGANDACAKGLTCVSYYGIAGARGPQFKTCEIKCKADANCPSGTKCVTIADGPGQVCRT
jgi:hypothetical protein